MSNRVVSRSVFAAALSMAGVFNFYTPTVHAQTTAAPAVSTAPISLQEFFRRAQISEFVPSPNGRYIAITADVNERFNVVVIDLETKVATAVTNWNNIDVGRLVWMSNDRILYQAISIGAPTGQDAPRDGGLFMVSRDGKESRQLAKTASQLAKGGSSGIARLKYLAPVPNSPDEIFALGGVMNDDSFDVYRVNVVNGRDRLVTQGRPADGISQWILDGDNVPRVAIGAGKGASTEIISYYRSTGTSPWKVLRKFDSTRPPAFVPLSFDKDNKTLFVASNDGRDNMAIYRYDPETDKILEQIAQHTQYDLGSSPAGPDDDFDPTLLFDPDTNELRGIRIDADRPETLWLDPKIKQAQATVDQALPGMNNRLRVGKDGKYFVTSFSDLIPGRFYVFEPEKRRLEMIGAARPWLDNRLSKVTPFKLKTRDGLEIPSYYVLPKDYKAGTKLPTVVHIHGGPFARDVVQGGRFGFSFGVREAQILASRGYAVVLPNFRITPELGSKIYYAGFGAYGKQMLDDHEDAAKWAVDQGFADPKKICISGASYGGYAALQALTRPTNPFACSISGLPVTDNAWQRANADYAQSQSAGEYWRKTIGVPSFSDPFMRESSPLYNAEKIKVPVFMYIGEEDARTPPRQAYWMRDAMAKAGNPMKDFFVGKGEGHGYGVVKTNIEHNERILKFLDGLFKN